MCRKRHGTRPRMNASSRGGGGGRPRPRRRSKFGGSASRPGPRSAELLYFHFPTSCHRRRPARPAPPPPAKPTNRPPPPPPAAPAGPNQGRRERPGAALHLCAPRDWAGPRGPAPGGSQGSPPPRPAPRPHSLLPRRRLRDPDGARRSPRTRAGSLCSPSRTGRCSPPAASSRRDLGDSAAATATPAAEPEKAAAAEPSPPGARSRPHLPPPPPRRGSAPRPAAPARGRLAAKRGRALRVPSRRSANRPAAARPEPPCGSGPLPDAVAARHFWGRGRGSRPSRGPSCARPCRGRGAGGGPACALGGHPWPHWPFSARRGERRGPEPSAPAPPPGPRAPARVSPARAWGGASVVAEPSAARAARSPRQGRRIWGHRSSLVHVPDPGTPRTVDKC